MGVYETVLDQIKNARLDARATRNIENVKSLTAAKKELETMLAAKVKRGSPRR